MRFYKYLIILLLPCISCSSTKTIKKHLNVYEKTIEYLKTEQSIDSDFNVSKKNIDLDLAFFSYYFCPYDKTSKLFIQKETKESKNLIYLNNCLELLEKRGQNNKDIDFPNVSLFENKENIYDFLEFSRIDKNLIMVKFKNPDNLIFGKYYILNFVIFFDENLEVTHSLRYERK